MCIGNIPPNLTGAVDHVSAEEIVVGVDICTNIKLAFDRKIAAVPIDNAACYVANAVVDKLEEAGEEHPLRVRDPCHNIDLPPKDLANVVFIALVVAEAKEIYNFVKNTRINAMREQLIDSGLLQETVTAKNLPETRMNLLSIMLDAARRQAPFLSLLPGHGPYQRWYEERTQSAKVEADRFLANCNYSRWQRFEAVIAVVEPFHKAHLVCSRRNASISVYPLVVQALKNEVENALTADGNKFDRVLR